MLSPSNYPPDFNTELDDPSPEIDETRVEEEDLENDSE